MKRGSSVVMGKVAIILLRSPFVSKFFDGLTISHPVETNLSPKILGYNNTLTLATKTMKFGENEGLNFNADMVEEEIEGPEGTAGTQGDSESSKERNASKATTTTQSSVPSVVSEVLQSASQVNKVNKELGIVFALAGAVGAWLW